jgi:hypothetical protein
MKKKILKKEDNFDSDMEDDDSDEPKEDDSEDEVIGIKRADEQAVKLENSPSAISNPNKRTRKPPELFEIQYESRRSQRKSSQK